MANMPHAAIQKLTELLTVETTPTPIKMQEAEALAAQQEGDIQDVLETIPETHAHLINSAVLDHTSSFRDVRHRRRVKSKIDVKNWMDSSENEDAENVLAMSYVPNIPKPGCSFDISGSDTEVSQVTRHLRRPRRKRKNAVGRDQKLRKKTAAAGTDETDSVKDSSSDETDGLELTGRTHIQTLASAPKMPNDEQDQTFDIPSSQEDAASSEEESRPEGHEEGKSLGKDASAKESLLSQENDARVDKEDVVVTDIPEGEEMVPADSDEGGEDSVFEEDDNRSNISQLIYRSSSSSGHEFEPKESKAPASASLSPHASLADEEDEDVGRESVSVLSQRGRSLDLTSIQETRHDASSDSETEEDFDLTKLINEYFPKVNATKQQNLERYFTFSRSTASGQDLEVHTKPGKEKGSAERQAGEKKQPARKKKQRAPRKKPDTCFTYQQTRDLVKRFANTSVPKAAMDVAHEMGSKFFNVLLRKLEEEQPEDRDTLGADDVKAVMIEMGLFPDEAYFNYMAAKYLPMEDRMLVIPCARKNNEVYPPEKKRRK